MNAAERFRLRDWEEARYNARLDKEVTYLKP